MSQTIPSSSSQVEANPIQQYYRFHSRIYDATRWIYLFGRETLLQKVASFKTPADILEVGCGTGKNLINLSRYFPQANITGLDMSESMLDVARQKLGSRNDRVRLIHKAYSQPLQPDSFDLILFSYSLTMINPDWSQVIEYASTDLVPGGLMAVVDFHDTALPFFKRWMGLNHVRMDGHLWPKLESCFLPRTAEICRAYGGFWTYLLFVGEKRDFSIIGGNVRARQLGE